MSSISKKILAIYLLVLALGVILSTLIYINGNSVSEATQALVSTNLPRLNEISKLRVAIAEQKPILYEYYATTDRSVFLKAFAANQTIIELGLRTIHSVDDSQSYLTQISGLTDKINEQARQLDHTLNTPPIDWDKARDILVEVSKTENSITPLIDSIVNVNQNVVTSSGLATQSKAQFMIGMVVGFSIVIFAIAFLIGYYVNIYIAESAERRRLAMFAERNPSPVLRSSWEGQLTYFNPAASILLSRLGLDGVNKLLPADFDTRLAALKSSADESIEFEYTIQKKTFDCVIHALRDLHIFHIYLADISGRKEAEERLVFQAYHDRVTGLPNRRMFNEGMQNLIRLAKPESKFAVVVLRIDRIKQILESNGYEASDNILRAMAGRLKDLLKMHSELAKGAQLFRFEGATFGVLFPELQSNAQLLLLVEKLQIEMHEPLHANEQDFFFTLSMGASIFPSDGYEPEDLFRNAEAAVNKARALGGDTFQSYTQDMNAKVAHWLALEKGLRFALERNELELHYQPQVVIASNQINGVEALLRWRRDGKNFSSPAEFIPIAEESGLIIPIGEWILRTACLQAKAWHQKGLGDLVMAVNISARQFQHPEFIKMVSSTLQQTGVDPNLLELEITESVAMHDAEKAIATLVELRELGIQLSIDDFGTGYSSLSYLKQFPINKLKVDQSFVRNMVSNANDASITKTVILLGQSLNLKVIAEGVETAEQLALLQDFGCDEVQGYFFSKPVPAIDLESLVSGAKFSGKIF